MIVDWRWAKSYIDDNSAYFTFVEDETFYKVTVFNGTAPIVSCKINKLLNIEDKEEFELSYKNSVVSKKLDEVGTLQLVKTKATTSAGIATILLKIPGTPGTKDARVINGGQGWFTSHHADDFAEVYITDEDDILGLGAGTVVGSYTDTDVDTANKGAYFSPDGILNIGAIGGMGRLVAGLYIKIIATKGDLSSDTFRCNIFWGLKS